MDLGTKVRNIRYNHNLSQSDMAKILEINRNNLSRIETNKSLPTSDTLMKIAQNFNISIDTLLGLDLDGKVGEVARAAKAKKISQYCGYLNNVELDFIINVLQVMTNHTKE